MHRRRSSASAPAAGSATCCRTPAAAVRRRWRRCCAACWWRPTRIPSSAGCSARSPPRTPSIYLDIDRDKAQILKVDPSAIFQALQASLGGYYVNDMNLFGRTWQVQVQAEAEDRSSIDDIYRINVRSADDQMIPLRSLVEVRPVIGPQALIRYNNQRRRDDPGQPGAGRLVRPGAGGDGAGRGEHAAARLSRAVDRCVVPGKAGRGQDRDHPRLRGAVRLPVPGRAVRELDDSRSGAAVGHRSALSAPSPQSCWPV